MQHPLPPTALSTSSLSTVPATAAVNLSPEAGACFLIHHQQVNSSLAPRHNAYVIHLPSCYHAGVVSSHIITSRVNTAHHVHRTFTTVCYYCSILLLVFAINFLLCLIYVKYYHRL